MRTLGFRAMWEDLNDSEGDTWCDTDQIEMSEFFQLLEDGKIDKNTLGQKTGLKDKNGVDIYEGDIVKILYTDWPSQLDSHPELSHEEYLDSIALTRVVIWSVQGFYVSHKVDGYAESMEPGAHGYIEVIGNIYNNHELC